MTLVLVLMIIVVFLAIDLFYQKIKTNKTILDSENSLIKNIRSFNFHNLIIPKNHFHSPGHTAFTISDSGNLLIGMDDFARNFLGEIKSITPSTQGEVKRGKTLFSVKTEAGEFNFNSPVSGAIVKFNESIEKDIDSSFNSSNNNWICIVTPNKLAEEIKTTRIAEEAEEWLKNEITRLKDFLGINNSTPATASLYDGGEILVGVSRELNKDQLNKFQNEFLA